MAIKDILIHVDNTKACARRMELATRLAVRHEAHLVALFARAFGNLPNLSSGHTREIDKQREESKARFEELARVNGLSAEFRVAECQSSVDLVTDNVLINARHVDLVILGQHDEDQADGSVPPGTPGAGRALRRQVRKSRRTGTGGLERIARVGTGGQ